jgi:hypothetical protein|tara:strand:+ start:104 stop:583 length:480 start_codon:yes stop_codon:yes gene_type:complete
MFEIKDNFFKKNQYNSMKNIVTDDRFSWFIQHGICHEGDKGVFFSHTFYNENGINSNFYEKIVIPFIEKLKIKRLFRAKLNLYTKTNKKIIHGFHKDREDNHMVVLFYFNENNGHTVFRNKKVKSEDNRAVMFNGSLEHSSTSCSDQDYRITLNLNYEL